LKLLSELLAKYPNTQFVKDRQKLIAQVMDQLAPDREKK
jgi:outer membrane protein assembly factor BamD (BamD/ComL family)